MKPNRDIAQELYQTLQLTDNALQDKEIAHLVINHNRVVGSHLIPGLEADVEELRDGIRVHLKVTKDTMIKKPVHLCFGMLPEKGLQEIDMQVEIEDRAQVAVFAHCTFPNAVDIIHKMDAAITIGEGADYSYLERHVHGRTGGIRVIPTAEVTVKRNARFKTDFELLRGRVGLIEINYETTCQEYSVMEMNAKINGLADDVIKIKEIGHLIGEGSRGVLTTRIAVRDNARAEVYNLLKASAPFARGHVDCKEIVQDNGTATATPIVEVNHPKAHITHEAAIGSVDKKQLETLMSRGMTEDDAVDLIIQGLLS
jgi:Fe-S cluster assembly scaffold protein SufB